MIALSQLANPMHFRVIPKAFSYSNLPRISLSFLYRLV